MSHRTRLSVNVNKIATLRNSRGKSTPDVLQVALDCVKFGAEGITVHPRPDERHIRRADVYALRPKLSVEFNIEGYPSPDFLNMVCDVRAEQCTLVPDPPHALTSNAGWRVVENRALLTTAVEQLHKSGVRVSVFVDPRTASTADFAALKELKVERVELYTEEYADAYPTARRDSVVADYLKTAEMARAHGLGVNAGHDLNTENLRHLVTKIDFIDEVSIGHALISDALYWGLETTIHKYLDCLK